MMLKLTNCPTNSNLPTLMKSICCLAGAVLALDTSVALGQTIRFPAKPVRIIVGAAPGGANDTVARVVAQRLTESWGQPVVVDNRPGASQMIAAEAVAKAAPDGYTLMLATQTALAVVPVLYRVPIDPIKDFAAVTLIGNAPLMLVVHPSLPAKSVKQLIALARAKPGDLNFGSGGIGSTPHMAGELFAAMAGIKSVNVAYKGEAPALIETIGGHLAMMFSNVPAAMPHVQSGKLRALAVTSVERLTVAPLIATVAESGLPGYEAQTWFGLVVTAATPREIVMQLNAEVLRVLARPDVRERLTAQGLTIVGNTPEQFAAHIKSEYAKWAKVIKESGAKVE